MKNRYAKCHVNEYSPLKKNTRKFYVGSIDQLKNRQTPVQKILYIFELVLVNILCPTCTVEE